MKKLHEYLEEFLVGTGLKSSEILSPVAENENLDTDAKRSYVAENQERERQAKAELAKGESAPTWDEQWTAFRDKVRKERPEANGISDDQLKHLYATHGEKLLGEKGTVAKAPKKEVKGMSVKAAVKGAISALPGGGRQAKAEESNYQQVIQVPSSKGDGSMETLPPHIAQALMSAFDPINEATNAAKVLHHPRSQTYMPDEVSRMGHQSWNHGENASYKPVADSVQSDGSIDRGLMRVNSNTFNGLMQRHPDWMSESGISSWDDMQDPAKNAMAARLVLKDSNYDPNAKGQTRKNPSYKRWFAAPLELRNR